MRISQALWSLGAGIKGLTGLMGLVGVDRGEGTNMEQYTGIGFRDTWDIIDTLSNLIIVEKMPGKTMLWGNRI